MDRESIEFMRINNLEAVFSDIRRQTNLLSCQVHNRRVSLDYDYGGQADTGFETRIYITKYCCEPFMKEVTKFLVESKSFDKVYIKKV